MIIDLTTPIFKKIDELTELEKYQCLASIPGSILELRSGYLPTDNSKINKSFLNEFKTAYSLNDNQKLSNEKKERKENYSFFNTLRVYQNMFPNTNERIKIIKSYTKHIFNKINLSANMNNSPKNIVEYTLCFKEKNIRITYPNNIVSLGLIWEIFVDEVYKFEEKVECIYDFGANIGLATLYFKILNPYSKVISIEPLTKNISIFKQNIDKNNLQNVQIICGAAGKTNDETVLYYSLQSEALPSLKVEQKNKQTVNVIGFDNIVKETNYGIKIDIEGSESELIYFPEIIKNARWIVGELHYSNDFEQNKKIDKLLDLLNENFEITLGKPIIYFVDKEVTLCRSFKTFKKKKA